MAQRTGLGEAGRIGALIYFSGGAEVGGSSLNNKKGKGMRKGP